MGLVMNFLWLGSDPDFNKTLEYWCRLFKGLGNCRVYHFSSLSLRKKAWNNGAKTFYLNGAYQLNSLKNII